MYTKDKSHRITLRLNEDQFQFVHSSADVLGVSPSDFLRMVINVVLSGAQKEVTSLDQNSINSMKEVFRRENEVANSNDKL